MCFDNWVGYIIASFGTDEYFDRDFGESLFLLCLSIALLKRIATTLRYRARYGLLVSS